jgi:ribonuclease-3
MKQLAGFLNKLGIEPKELSNYRRAFTHISAATNPSESYERLEFLGDSVIGLVISDFLCRAFPDKEEGDLSRIKAMVVSQESLSTKAVELGLEKYLRADTVRVREGRHTEPSILADSFESLVGAIFIDRGYRIAKTFVLKQLREDCLNLRDMSGPSDYKSQLQELWQRIYKDTPEYEVITEVGPDHRKEFTVEVSYKGKSLGTGTGASKKKAEQEAARVAVEHETGSGKPAKKRRTKRV